MSNESITGRDGYICAKALYQACKYQESLKNAGSTHYEWSDHQDMKAILTQLWPQFAGIFVLEDRYRKEEPANLNDLKKPLKGDEKCVAS